MKSRLLLTLLLLTLATGCTAMMMGGNGGYRPAGDCSEQDRAAGLCKSR